eukprot:5204684-Pyramimonas_sp.AAC.1
MRGPNGHSLSLGVADAGLRGADCVSVVAVRWCCCCCCLCCCCCCFVGVGVAAAAAVFVVVVAVVLRPARIALTRNCACGGLVAQFAKIGACGWLRLNIADSRRPLPPSLVPATAGCHVTSYPPPPPPRRGRCRASRRRRTRRTRRRRRRSMANE